LYVCDLDPKARERAKSFGAIICDTPKDLADQAGTVIGCLPTVNAARQILADGVLNGKVKHYIEMSTIGPASAAEHAEMAKAKDCAFIDAAVSGGSGAALSGELVIMLAGEAKALTEIAPLIETLSSRHFLVGEAPGQAQAMKLVNNLL